MTKWIYNKLSATEHLRMKKKTRVHVFRFIQNVRTSGRHLKAQLSLSYREEWI